MINIEEMINMMLIKRKMKKVELAEKLGITLPSISAKIRRSKMSVCDLEEIVNAAGCKMVIKFVLPDDAGEVSSDN